MSLITEIFCDSPQYQADVQAAVKNRQHAMCIINEVTDPELVEAAIHEFQAADLRLNYLLRQAKERENMEG